MRQVPFSASISKTDFIRNSCLPLSPPLSTSQTPNASPSSFSHDNNSQNRGMQEKQSSPVQTSRPPPSPTSSVTTPTSVTGPDAAIRAPVPNAWKTVGSPSGLHLTANESQDAKGHRSSELRDHIEGYEEFELELSSDDGYYDGPKLIGTRRSSEGANFGTQNMVRSQYKRDATGDANLYLSSPGHLGERRGSDVGSNASSGMSTSPVAPTKWGSLGFQWTAGPSIWNGNPNGNGRGNSVVGGSSSPPPDEAPTTRSVSFSVVDRNGTRSPIGTGPLDDRSALVGYMDEEYDQEEQPQYRQSRSLSFALGQQETDFFGGSNDTQAQSSNSSSHANFLARRSASSAMAHSFDDSELYRSAPGYGSEHSAASRGLENSYHQSLPPMTEEYDTLEGDHPSMSPSDNSYVAFTLPKMRARNKSSTATFGGMGRDNTVSSHNSSSTSSPITRVRAPNGFNNGLSPQQQQQLKSVTAPSSVSSSPYRHRSSGGGMSKPSSADDSASIPAYASIWRDEDNSQQTSSSHNATTMNQRRRSITTPNEYWPVTGTMNSPQQNAGRLTLNMNASGGNYSQGNQSPSPELLERVRIHRRLSLNPALSARGNQGGMSAGGMNMGMGSGPSNNNMGMGSTGNYGEYRYLESGQGLGMLNRSVEPEYAHLNQRRHSVAGPTLSFGNSSQSRYLTDALDALQLEDNSVYGNQQHHGFGASVEESSLDDYFDNDERRAARVAAATASGNYGGIANSASTLGRGGAPGLGHSGSRDVDAHLGKGVPLHAVPHHGPLYIVEFKAGRSDLFYLVPESPNQQVKKGDLVIVEADRGKDLGKVVNDNITPVQVQMLQQQQAEAAAVAEMGISILPDGSLPRMVGGISGSGGVPVKELHPKRIYRLAQPSEVTMLVTKSQDEAKAMLLCQTKVRQKNLPMEVVDAEYQWDRRKLTFYFIAERRIDFRELVRELFKIYKTRIWMCAVNPNVNSAMNALRK